MVTQQILSKVINDRNLFILQNNGLTVEYFPEYEEEYTFIQNHTIQYGNVPDEATFLSNFPDFTLLEVQESEEYLVHTVEEEKLYATAVPVLQQCADLLQTDSRDAVEFLRSKLSELQAKGFTAGVDLISQADQRYQEWLDRTKEDDDTFIKSSFTELDNCTGGWRRGEEMVVLFARTGHGKTFVLLEILRSAWEQGNVIGLIEPEMSPNSVGYRLDTLQAHISNSSLYRGYGADAYEQHIEDLKIKETPFWVASPRHFNKNVTVPKLKSWCINNKIDILAIDGISYLRDIRAARTDSRTIQLTNISEDLMELSIDLGIPVFLVCQSNRGGIGEDAPGLENIRDSDGIAYNASVVISLRKYKIEDEPVIMFSLEKTRNGPTSDRVIYNCDIDHGIFTYRAEDDEHEEIVATKRTTSTAPRTTRRVEEAF